MKRFVKFLLFILAAVGLGYLACSRREEIKEKIKILEEKVKNSKFSLNIKDKFNEIINDLKSKVDNVDKTQEDNILNIVEEKIRKLEELIKQEKMK
ncbi:phosphohydrolase [Sulfurihydrogenibium azorense]|uniref:phosphohydrolase n=1 Tax=Sulfurihydrogenibium azorense TaxID=309806 RepID=UPI002409855C|nr:phosphohydrolase [Sulfurihydrogenibium azorense]MDM7273367.1 phosphohydrolase [Sulfurihydrogenibium azorense]